MSEELNKEAEVLIKKYRPITNKIAESGYSSDFYAKHFAIIECQSIIKELELINDGDENFVGTLDDRITHYQSLIKQIEIQ